MNNTPIAADLDGLVERDHTFCSVVWEALKGDHNDLRKEAIILRAFRAVIAALPSPDLDGPCPICKGIEGCSHTVLERMSATITALRGEVEAEKLKYAILKGMNAACESKLAEQSEAATLPHHPMI